MPIGKDVALAINDEVRIQRGRGQDHCAQARDTGGIEYHCTTRRAIKGQRGQHLFARRATEPRRGGICPARELHTEDSGCSTMSRSYLKTDARAAGSVVSQSDRGEGPKSGTSALEQSLR